MEEYQSWKYNALEENGKIRFEVIPSEERKAPNSFFKYYSLNQNNVKALTGCYVYASHPNQFNDSVDCNSQILNFQNASQEDLRGLYPMDFYPKFLEIYGDEQFLKCCTSEHFKTLFYRHVGIVSLSTNNDSIYFWNSYTQNGQGFCVEWDVNKFPFRKYGPFPIHYVENIKPFEVRDNIPTAALIQTNIKTKDWQEENEWRLLVSNPEGLDFNLWDNDGSYSQQYNLGDEHNRKMKYPLGAIKGVTLGEWFFRSQNIRQYPITEDEREIVFLNKKETLRCQILDFLGKKLFPVYQVRNNLGILEVLPIVVVKLQNRVYRIININ